MPFITLCFFAGCILAMSFILIVIFKLFRKKTRARGIKRIKMGMLSLVCCISGLVFTGASIANQKARSLGFDDAADQRAAEAEHIQDGQRWHVVKSERQASLARANVAQAKVQEELAAEAQAQAKQKSQAAEAKAEQARHVAEAQAKAEQTRSGESAQAADAYERAQKQYAQSAIRSMALFNESLKDPANAAVQDVKVSKLPDGKVALCGLVNGKNSFGAYIGYRRFVVSADLGVAQFEGPTQDASFDSAWYNWCDR